MSFPTYAFKKIKYFLLILQLAQVIEPSMKHLQASQNKFSWVDGVIDVNFLSVQLWQIQIVGKNTVYST